MISVNQAYLFQCYILLVSFTKNKPEDDDDNNNNNFIIGKNT